MGRARPAPYPRGGKWWGDFKRLKAGRHPLKPEGQTRGLDVLGRGHSKADRESNMLEAIRLLERDWTALERKAKQLRDGITDADAGVPRPLMAEFIAWKSQSENEEARVSKKEMQSIERGCNRILGLKCVRTWDHIRSFNTGKSLLAITNELRTLKTGNGQPYASATRRQWCMAFSGLLTYARHQGLIDTNQWNSNVFMPSGAVTDELRRHVPQHFLTPAEIKAVLHVADLEDQAGLSHRNPYLRDIVYVLAYTGARREEALRLLRGHVDFENDIILIPGTKGGEETRMLPLHAPLKRRLKWYRNRRQPLDLLFPSVSKRKRKDPAAEAARLAAGPQPMLGVAKGIKRVMLAAGIAPEKFLSPMERQQLAGDSPAVTIVPATRARAACHHIWRHSYAMARLGMVRRADNGKPVRIGEREVALELGHATEKQIVATYGRRPDRVIWPTFRLDFSKAPGPAPTTPTAVRHRGLTTKPKATSARKRVALASPRRPASASASRRGQASATKSAGRKPRRR
jgi:integrase